MNEIELKPMAELWGMDFFIPSYQRGYRWTEQQIRDLLDDILEFARKKKEEKEFYCLQPIVVKTYTWQRDEKPIKGWEVVDGQQRLTTIRILLEYFKKEYLAGKSYKDRYNKEVFRLDYETRPETEKFLQNILSGSGVYDSYIDDHFITTAYETIAAWFTQKKEKGEMPDDLCDTILRTLVYDKEHQKQEGIVQVIWYDIRDDKNPIKTFTRINMGKIPLTNSELIKALFLRERNFSEDKELMELRQLQIASEWDRIENALQNDDFWWFLNKEKNDLPARIEFIFELMREIALQKKPSLKEKIGGDQYAAFRYFYTIFAEEKNNYETIKKTWDEVKEYFHCFEDWFNNYTWYHYIGFLICCGENITGLHRACKEGIHEKNMKIPVATKEDVNKVLEYLIGKHFSGIEWEYPEGQKPYIDLSYNNKNKSLIRKLLLLYNIEYIVRQCNNKHLVYKFPFKSFKEGTQEGGKLFTWDVEHIDSYTENGLNDKPSQDKWLESSDHALAMFEHERKALNIPDSGNGFDDLHKRINRYRELEKKDDDVFNDLYEQIQEVFGENENDEELKNNIGNLTLLDSGTNRGYKNALFRSKREIIIQKDREGVFIPIGTRNVFLKYFDTEGISPASWSVEDIENYRNDMAWILRKFLPPCQDV
jgi:hypothetical protein